MRRPWPALGRSATGKIKEFKRLSIWAWPSGTGTGAFFSFVLSDTVFSLAVHELWLQVIIRVRKYIISRIDTDMWEYFKCLFVLHEIKKIISQLCQMQVNKSFRRIPVCYKDRPLLGWHTFMHYSVEFHPGIIFCFYILLMKFDIYISNNLAMTAFHWRFTPALSSLYVCVWDVNEGKTILGHTVVQIVAGLLLMRTWFDTGPVLVGFVVAEVTIRQFSLTGFRVSPVSIIPPMPHIHSSIYHQRCIMFFSQHFSFPCQYHSTNAPYSFIHLPPTLYNVFLPALQFPLSVSFHQCSILIHSPTTNAV